VPDNNSSGVTRTFTVTNPAFRVEHATLTVTLPHARHGDLAIKLLSPRGTESRLAELHSSSGAGYNTWTFSSVRYWAENAHGDWTVKIADLAYSNTGTLNALQLDLHGSVPQPVLALAKTNATARLSLQAAALGWSYALETSTNLLDWHQAATLALGANGQATFSDTNAAAATVFYRARLLP
jgi:subtilisin-like proprotein convertase family protein